MLNSFPMLKKHLGAPLQSRKAMLETLFRHLDMVRLSAAGVVMLALVSCTGLIDGGNSSGGRTPQQASAVQLWQTKAYPDFTKECIECHASPAHSDAPQFLAGKDALAMRDTLLASTEVDLDAPGSSRILTKGFHNGPQWQPAEAADVLGWVQAEKDAEATDPSTTANLLAIPAFQVKFCVAPNTTTDCAADTTGTMSNTVPFSMLGAAGKAFPNAQITFLAQQVGNSLYLSRLSITGGDNGVEIEHPLFVSRPANAAPIPDEIDRYFDLKLEVPPTAMTASMQIDGGTAYFQDFASDRLEIDFKNVAAYKPDGSSAPPGCKVLTSFTTNAAPQLQTGTCTTCHSGQNASATANMDLTQLGKDQQTACNQVLTRINLTTPAQSAVLVTPAPGGTAGHPFHLSAAAFQTFSTAMNLWITDEKTAP